MRRACGPGESLTPPPRESALAIHHACANTAAGLHGASAAAALDGSLDFDSSNHGLCSLLLC
jgi:hypothetical protein